MKAQSFLISDKAQMTIRLPKRVSKAKTQKVARKSIAQTDGWIDTKATKRKKTTPTTKKKQAPSSEKKTASDKRSKKKPKTAKLSKPSAPDSKATATEVIELDDDSSAEGSTLEVMSERRASLRQRPKAQPAYAADTLWDDESEKEF
jgi:hypothetical protein